MGSSSTWAERARHRLRSRLDRHPAVFPWQMQLRGKAHLLVRRDTELVVEGYPRSGNTFAVAALMLSQPRELRLARHTHAPAQVLLAVRWQVPVLLVVRDPVDAAASRMVYAPHLSAEQALRDYVTFHEDLAPVRAAMVAASFEEVTADFGRVVHRLNERFSLGLAPFRHDEASERAVFAKIEELERLNWPDASVPERTVPRPSPERRTATERCREVLLAPPLAELRRSAEGLRRRFVDGVGS